MIVKELDPFPPTADPRERAGRVAEEHMAFYLRRAFAADPDVRIFNGIRLEHAGDAAQVDHLVLHKWGLVVIESKSVTTRVKINAQGEWTRLVQGSWRGMPSPVLQAQRQADFVRARLKENVAHLLDRMLGLQMQFGAMPLDVLVAISDGGMIDRGSTTLPQVCKADQVPQEVQALVDRYRKSNGAIGLLLGSTRHMWHTLHPDEMTRLVMFFRHQHRPLHPPSTLASSPPSAPVQSLVAGMDLPPPDQIAPFLPPTSAHYGETGMASTPSYFGHSDAYVAQPSAAFRSAAGMEGAASLCCALCGVTVSRGVARYCLDNIERFGGQVYCMAHQRGFRARQQS